MVAGVGAGGAGGAPAVRTRPDSGPLGPLEGSQPLQMSINVTTYPCSTKYSTRNRGSHTPIYADLGGIMGYL